MSTLPDGKRKYGGDMIATNAIDIKIRAIVVRLKVASYGTKNSHSGWSQTKSTVSGLLADLASFLVM